MRLRCLCARSTVCMYTNKGQRFSHEHHQNKQKERKLNKEHDVKERFQVRKLRKKAILAIILCLLHSASSEFAID